MGSNPIPATLGGIMADRLALWLTFVMVAVLFMDELGWLNLG
jgi:hypothetical protein